ncbi:MAG: DNA-binding protein, partial [Oscillospiraceae bacterium]|nr:DNA-binding protein [Oscillospiraceae bacterium]
LGAANDVTIGIFDTAQKKYYSRRCQGDYEISALVGNVTRKDGEPYLHLHVTIGNPVTGELHAGHLSSCTISATLELFLQVWDGEVERKFSQEIGLNLLEF